MIGSSKFWSLEIKTFPQSLWYFHSISKSYFPAIVWSLSFHSNSVSFTLRREQGWNDRGFCVLFWIYIGNLIVLIYLKSKLKKVAQLEVDYSFLTVLQFTLLYYYLCCNVIYLIKEAITNSFDHAFFLQNISDFNGIGAINRTHLEI